MDKNLVFLHPPDDVIKKRAYPTLDLLWVRVLLCWNGRGRMGGGAKSPLIVVYFYNSPLKNMMGQKFSLSTLP
jgi:hypothetical protein